MLIDTVQRYKGLESAIVFVWGLDTLRLPDDQELCDVAMTRAKSLLFIVASDKMCSAISQLQLCKRHYPDSPMGFGDPESMDRPVNEAPADDSPSGKRDVYGCWQND